MSLDCPRTSPQQRRRLVRLRALSALLAVGSLFFVPACSDGGDDSADGSEDSGATGDAGSATSTEAGDAGSATSIEAGGGTAEEGSEKESETLTILVSNDDGVGAEGIDVLVKALSAMPDTQVVVSAPAEDRTGSGGNTTPGGVQGVPATTASGHEAFSVAGFPADSVNWALEGGVDVKPQLVVTGINKGQNIGKLVDVSGTVGAARAGAAKGIPALAVSAGMSDAPDYEAAAELAVEWIEENREALLSGELGADTVFNLNVPTCAAGEVRGVVEAELDTASEIAFTPVDCTQATPQPAGDVASFAAGFAPLSTIPVAPGS